MDPRDFQKLAVELARLKSEAEMRTAVSRAYYAALNHAAQLTEGIGVSIPDDWRFHNVVADSLINIEPGLKHELENLKLERGRADYRVWGPWESDEVEDALDTAEHIISTLDEKLRGGQRGRPK